MRTVITDIKRVNKNKKITYYELFFKTVDEWNLYKKDVLDRFYNKIDSSHYSSTNTRIHIVQLF